MKKATEETRLIDRLHEKNAKLENENEKLKELNYKLEHPLKYKEGQIIGHFKIRNGSVCNDYGLYNYYNGYDYLDGREKQISEEELEKREQRIKYLYKNNLSFLLKIINNEI